jgi:hypothetical protein
MLTIVMCDVAKLRVIITLRETFDPQSRIYKMSNQREMIRGMTNSGNSNKEQYERYDGLLRIRKIHRLLSLRGCRDKNGSLRKVLINNIIK